MQWPCPTRLPPRQPPCRLPPSPLNPTAAVGICTTSRRNTKDMSHRADRIQALGRRWSCLAGKQYFHVIYAAAQTAAMETKNQTGWSPNPAWREIIRITSGCLKSPVNFTTAQFMCGTKEGEITAGRSNSSAIDHTIIQNITRATENHQSTMICIRTVTTCFNISH